MSEPSAMAEVTPELVRRWIKANWTNGPRTLASDGLDIAAAYLQVCEERNDDRREAYLRGYRDGRDDHESGIWDDLPRTPYPKAPGGSDV